MFKFCDECKAMGLAERPEYTLAVQNFISLLQQYNLPKETTGKMLEAAKGCYLFRGLVHQSEFGLDKSNPDYWNLLRKFAESAIQQADDDPFYSNDTKQLLEEVEQYLP